jgi:transcriptional/translational regulatory protein YebC/TACO1
MAYPAAHARAGHRRKDRARAVLALLDALEDNDDVQNVFSNEEIPDDIMEKVTAAAA